jgi:uncharacterized membrane protein YccC
LTEPVPSAARSIATGIRASRRTPFLQVVKTSVAVVVAWVVAGLALRIELPIFAAIAALLVVQPSVNQSLGRAIERSVGVVVGVLLAVAATTLFGKQGWLVLVAVAAVLLLAWAFRIASGSANQAAISALLVLAIGVTTPNYALDRVVETVIGGGIGLLINVAIAPPVLLEPAHAAVDRLGRDLADALQRLGEELTAPTDAASREELLRRARALRTTSAQAKAALDQGDESLLLNPRRSRNRDQLAADRALWTRIDPIATQVAGMTRSVRDNWDEDLADDPVVGRIAEECARAAADLRSLMAEGGAGEAAAERETALTAPVVVLAPDPAHWIVVGALLEDLRRIREEILEPQERP